MKRIRGIAAALALFLMAGAWNAASAQGDREVILTILHTNDMHGHVLGSDGIDGVGPGGLARITTMAREIQRDMPNVLFLDAGDIIHSTPTEYYSQGAATIEAMSVAGIEAATMGNHEYDWGQDVAASIISLARFPMLSANVRDTRTGKPFGGAREYIIVRRGPLKIAIFGLTTMLTPDIQWPPAISNIRFDDPVEAARRLVPELRKKADVVIFLSHLGYQPDQELVRAVPGIDVVIGGHSHTTLNQHTFIGDTPIAQTGSYSRNLGRMDLRLVREGNRWKVDSVNGRDGVWWADQPSPPLGKTYPKAVLLPVGDGPEMAPDVLAAYRKHFDPVAALLDTPLASVPETIAGENGTRVPRLLQPTLADLMRRALNVDIAMIADATPRLEAGTATLRSVYEIIPGYTRQNVVVVRPTGAAIREAVLKAYALAGTVVTGRVQAYPAYFAGLNGRIVRDGDTVRWENPAVNGRPLDDNATYTLAAGAFPIMDYPSLMDSPMVSDQVGWVKPLVAEGMRQRRVIYPYLFGLELPEPPAAR